jgi:hypothetical protein
LVIGDYLRRLSHTWDGRAGAAYATLFLFTNKGFFPYFPSNISCSDLSIFLSFKGFFYFLSNYFHQILARSFHYFQGEFLMKTYTQQKKHKPLGNCHLERGKTVSACYAGARPNSQLNISA